MLIPVELLKKDFGVTPKSILHIGAHKAEELDEYTKHWFPFEQPIYWVEGQPLLAHELRNRTDLAEHVVVEAFVWNVHGETRTFNLSSNSQSSSFLMFGTHLEKIPAITMDDTLEVQTVRLDRVLSKDLRFEFINLDLQGVELQALQGLGNIIRNTNWIYTEVNKEEVYKGCTLVTDLDAYLKQFGFKRVITKWVRGLGWGDALYIHKSHMGGFLFRKITFAIRNSAQYIKHQLLITLK